MPYTQQVLTVLVHDRQRSIALDRSLAPRERLRRRAANAAYAVAKAVTVVAVALDDEPVRYAAERAR